MAKADKHYQPWPLEECREYFKLYMKSVRSKDLSVLQSELAEHFGRTRSAIGFKRREVVGVLTDGEEGIYTYGENMVKATNEAFANSGMSVTTFRMLFE